MSTIEETRKTIAQPVTRRDVLHRAADLLEEFGWCQGNFGYCGDEIIDEPEELRRADRMCAAGALLRANADLTGGELNDNGSSYMIDLYDAVVRSDDLLISAWNDASSRTKAEVVTRLREAAEDAA